MAPSKSASKASASKAVKASASKASGSSKLSVSKALTKASVPKDLSHFVPYQVVNALDGKRPGPDYSDNTNKKVNKVLDSKNNTSVTTAAWNRGQNKRHENEIVAVIKGNKKWSDLTPGAARRYEVQANHWKDIRSDIKPMAPGLVREMDKFYKT